MAAVAKTADSTAQRLANAARVRSDRTRDLYVNLRRVSTPVRSLRRSRAVPDAPAGLRIPEDEAFLLVPPGRFPETADLAAEAQRLEREADLEELRKRGKDFMLPLLTPPQIGRDDAITRFALREDVIAAVSAYLGVVPILSSMNVYRSSPGTRDRLVSSQLFHCDGDDTRQIKVFVLCGTVTEQNGPLMLLDAARSKELRDRAGYRYKDRVTDEDAKRLLGERLELTPVVGEAGTACFVDTSRCFHYGSRVGDEADARLVAIIQYLTPYSFMLPRDYRAKAPYRGLADSSLSELERLVLGVE